MNSDQEGVWNLVPPGSPPSAPALHKKAKNRPYALLLSLEPPRGPDFFPMERFRRRWSNSDTPHGNVGFSRFAGDTCSENGEIVADVDNEIPGRERRARPGGPVNLSAARISGSAPVSFNRGVQSSGRTPCSSHSQEAAGSQASSMETPQRGFSLFGGKAHATPGSYGRHPSPQSAPSIEKSSTHGERMASGGGGGAGGGLTRFKTLAQQRQEEEKIRRHAELSRSDHSGPALGSPPAPASSYFPPTPCGASSSGSFGHPFRTPSPISSYVAGACGAPVTPVASSGRKRLRAPSRGSAPSASKTTRESPFRIVPVVQAKADEGRSDPSTAPSGARHGRTWGGVEDGNARGQQEQRNEVRTASRGGVGKEAPTPVSRHSLQNPNRRSLQSPRSRLGSTSPPLPSKPSAPLRRYTLADFAGADEVCFNPGASRQALTVFLERCEARGTVALSMLWADLTTGYSSVTVKSCLPSKQCFRWNCACGRQPRARQATAPIVGAVVYLPPNRAGLTQGPYKANRKRQAQPFTRRFLSSREPRSGARDSPPLPDTNCRELSPDDYPDGARVGGEETEGGDGCSREMEFDEAETYLLPLGACDGETKEAAEAGGYQLPLQCDSTFDERWGALAKLVALPVKKIAFNAQVVLMPLIAWRRANSTVSFDQSAKGAGEGSHPTDEASISTAMVSELFDPRVAAWMTDTGSTDKALEFEALCFSRLQPTKEDGRVEGGSAPQGGKSAIVTAVLHLEKCSRRSLALAAKLSEELREAKMLKACEQVEMPAIPVLAGMEVSGIVFLPERVTRFSAVLGNLLEGLRRSAAAAAGGKDFNLASPDQVADVLFKHLKLPSPPVKAGSAHASTSAEVLEGLLGKHPVVAPVLEFRGVNKYKTTYVDKLSEKATGAAPADSAVPVASQGAGAVRIHAAWNQTSVRTGRLSCSRPNLQQIPKSSDPLVGVAGVNVRDAFVASKGFTLMAADYSQIEMRVLADACGDPALSELFASIGSRGGDIYRRLAAQVFRKEEGVISDHERTRAKVVCLGIIYGMGTPQVARKLEVTESQAQGLVRSFLRAFPKIDVFLAATRRYARERGYVCTLTGRRRNLSQINNAQSAALKAQAERQAVNSVIQGTAADIIKTAMVLVARRLDEWRSRLEDGLDCPRLVMQIHDELVLECPACEEDLERLKGVLIECMEVQAPAMLGIKCPLAVNMLVGMSWGSMRKVVSKDDGED